MTNACSHDASKRLIEQQHHQDVTTNSMQLGGRTVVRCLGDEPNCVVDHESGRRRALP